MKILAVGTLAFILFGGCSSTGQPALDGDRIAADVNCLRQLALDGYQIYTQHGVTTSKEVATAIGQASTMTEQAGNACSQTLKYGGMDAAAIKAKIEAGKGQPAK